MGDLADRDWHHDAIEKDSRQMRNLTGLFWRLVFAGTIVEYFYLRQKGDGKFHGPNSLVTVLAIAMICALGYFITNLVNLKKRDVKTEGGSPEISSRPRMSLISMYSSLGLLLLILNLVPVFNKSDYAGRNTILAGLNTPLLVLSTAVMIVLGAVLFVRSQRK